MIVSLSRYFSCSSTKPGISALHGPHHVAQKLSRMTLPWPLNDASATSVPSRAFNLKSQFAGFGLAMHEAPSPSAGVVSCEAAGVTVAVVVAGVSLCGCRTNGMLMPSRAIAVAATAIMRMLLDGAADATDGVSAVG